MRKQNLRRMCVGAFAAVSIWASVAANALDCAGKISHVLMYSNGLVMVVGNWRSDYTAICSTDGTWGGISTEICLSWYAAALKARADNSSVDLYYPNPGSATCATLPTYGSSLPPGYLLVFPG